MPAESSRPRLRVARGLGTPPGERSHFEGAGRRVKFLRQPAEPRPCPARASRPPPVAAPTHPPVRGRPGRARLEARRVTQGRLPLRAGVGDGTGTGRRTGARRGAEDGGVKLLNKYSSRPAAHRPTLRRSPSPSDASRLPAGPRPEALTTPPAVNAVSQPQEHGRGTGTLLPSWRPSRPGRASGRCDDARTQGPGARSTPIKEPGVADAKPAPATREKPPCVD